MNAQASLARAVPKPNAIDPPIRMRLIPQAECDRSPKPNAIDHEASMSFRCRLPNRMVVSESEK